MCRMIAAVGSFDADPLIEALRTMALNENAAYEHEHRHLGPGLLHDCGWGAAFRGADGLSVHRSAKPCFEEGELAGLAETLRGTRSGGPARGDGHGGESGAARAGMLVLHARRTKRRDTIALENTHPFRAEWGGLDHAFCHNGEVRDLSQLSWDPLLHPRGTTDSERLFFHLLTRLDPSGPAESVAATMSRVRDFTSLNCLLITGRSVIAHARVSPGSSYPRYYTLWRGRGAGVDVVSSEIVAGLDVDWREVSDCTAFVLGDGI